MRSGRLGVDEMKLELHDSMVVDREDRERGRRLDVEVGEGDGHRAGDGHEATPARPLPADADLLRDAVQGELARGRRAQGRIVRRERAELDWLGKGEGRVREQ